MDSEIQTPDLRYDSKKLEHLIVMLIRAIIGRTIARIHASLSSACICQGAADPRLCTPEPACAVLGVPLRGRAYEYHIRSTFK